MHTCLFVITCFWVECVWIDGKNRVKLQRLIAIVIRCERVHVHDCIEYTV